MYQLTVTVTTLTELLELGAHLQELPFLVEQITGSAPAQTGDTASPPSMSPASGAGPSTEQSTHSEQGSTESDAQPATDRQVNYLNDLALKSGWELHVFEEQVRETYELDDFSELTKQMASDLITRLQTKQLQPALQG